MKRTFSIAVIVVFVFAHAIFAQAPTVPKPGPEHKRLAYFAGNWKSEGEMKTSVFGPRGKFTGSDHNEWLPGGFFLVMHSDAKGPMGEMKSLAVLGYDSDAKVYTYHAFSGMGGPVETAKGTVQGTTWNWTSESKMQGKTVKGRVTIKEQTPTAYGFKWESSTDGGASWATIMDTKVVKVK